MSGVTVSIIIRSRNEERWIGHCLDMVFKQDLADFEVVIVDNQSEDHTVEVARRFPVGAIVPVSDYRPGAALNLGIRRSTGRYITCLSAHCIPQRPDWLSTLAADLGDPKVAGVYGRQLPLPFSPLLDKRDLLTVFGLDKRVQVKDYFFHNANSMVRRDVWDEFPFDEAVSNLEDRLWAKTVVDAGYRLIYEPEAAVYHHHGINQSNDLERARGVASTLDRVDAEVAATLPESLKPENCNIAAVVPVLGELRQLYGYDLFSEALRQLKEARYARAVYAISENDAVRSLAESHEVNFIARPKRLLDRRKTIGDVLKFALSEIEKGGNYPDAILFVNYLYPFRPPSLFDELITELRYQGLDTVFPGYVDYSDHWLGAVDGRFQRLSESVKPAQDKPRVYRSLYGLGCATNTSIIRSGRLVGGRIGIVPIHDHIYALRCTDEQPEGSPPLVPDPGSPVGQSHLFLKEFRP